MKRRRYSKEKKCVPVNISITEEARDLADLLAAQKGISRSEMIEILIRLASSES